MKREKDWNSSTLSYLSLCQSRGHYYSRCLKYHHWGEWYILIVSVRIAISFMINWWKITKTFIWRNDNVMLPDSTATIARHSAPLTPRWESENKNSLNSQLANKRYRQNLRGNCESFSYFLMNIKSKFCNFRSQWKSVLVLEAVKFLYQ